MAPWSRNKDGLSVGSSSGVELPSARAESTSVTEECSEAETESSKRSCELQTEENSERIAVEYAQYGLRFAMHTIWARSAEVVELKTASLRRES